MSKAERHIPVIIIGGGPVGLYLGILLAAYNIPFHIFEKRSAPNPHSRSIGIHPVSLELFDEAGITGDFLKKGLTITRGHAFVNTDQVGTVSFGNLSGRHRYILALPQYQTEKILELTLTERKTEGLTRNAELQDIRKLPNDRYQLTVNEEGTTKRYSCDYLIGCDGKNSSVRKRMDINLQGEPYPDTYLMGDMDDTTSFGSDAAVFLHQEGVVESFPLPEGKRRWVVKTDHYIQNPDRKILSDYLQERLGVRTIEAGHYMVSSFGVQHYLAARYVAGQVILVGDAAHVVSPIGGQGMNLGWLDAHQLAHKIDGIINKNRDSDTALAQYENQQKAITRKVARRAAFNMKLGRKFRSKTLRKILLHGMVNTPAQNVLARLFAMQNLKTWPV